MRIKLHIEMLFTKGPRLILPGPSTKEHSVNSYTPGKGSKKSENAKWGSCFACVPPLAGYPSIAEDPVIAVLHSVAGIPPFPRLCELSLEFLGFLGITVQQSQIHLSLSWGSFHGSYCSNIELGDLTWAFLNVPIMCMLKERDTRSASGSE